MSEVQKLIDWYGANAAIITTILFHVFCIGRAVAKYTKNTWDDGVWLQLHKIAAFFGLVIPDTEPPVTTVTSNRTWMGELGGDFLLASGAGADELVYGGRKKLLARFIVRRVARQNGLDADDETVDAVLDELENRAGSVKDFIQWLMDNRETIVAIIKMIMLFLAEEKTAKAKKGTV